MMAEQIVPAGSLASALPMARMAVAVLRPTPEMARPVESVDSQPQAQDSGPVTESAKPSAIAMEQVNSFLNQAGSELKFQVDKATGHTIFKIVDPSSGTVVLQVPSEEMMAMARNLRAIETQLDAPGVLVDKEG